MIDDDTLDRAAGAFLDEKVRWFVRDASWLTAEDGGGGWQACCEDDSDCAGSFRELHTFPTRNEALSACTTLSRRAAIRAALEVVNG